MGARRRGDVPRPCPTPGCPHLAPCPVHVKEPWAGSTREARLPAGWKKKRARILRRDHHRCQWIDEHGPCPLPATEVDHVDPQGGDGDHNLRALCAPHHRTKSAREGALVRNQRPLGE